MDRLTSASRRDRSSPVAPTAYTPYGYSAIARSSQTGYVGAVQEALRGCYGFGQGYRYLNSVLMRFETPDSWSPFEQGGLNAYAYCAGDPVNYFDPTGHAPRLFKFRGLFKRRKAAPVEAERPAIDSELAQARETVKRKVGFILRPENSADMRSNLDELLRNQDFRTSAAQVLDPLQLNSLASNLKVWEGFAPGTYRDRKVTRIEVADAVIQKRYSKAVATLDARKVPPHSFERQLRHYQIASMNLLDRSVMYQLKKIRDQL